MVTTAPLFEDAFWDLLCKDEAALSVLDSVFDKERTYLFELCTQTNRVVTKYSEDKLFLIGSRHRATGKPLLKPELDELALKVSRVTLFHM